MRKNIHHPTFTELADLVDGRVDVKNQGRNKAHLAECAACAERLEAIAEVLGIMRSDRSPEPHAQLVAEAAGLFQPVPIRRRARMALAGLTQEIGRLVFDSLDQPAFAAARGVMSGRRLRFEAAGLELDLLAERRGGKINLIGQVTRSAGQARALAGARFLVLAGGKLIAQGITDAIGEFMTMMEATGEIRVVVIDGDRQVTFPLPANLDP
jgi:anti-sigma factor RsiW